MRRKIVKQGSATMTISLPASWIKKFNLIEGDELEIDEIGNQINISTAKATASKAAELNSSQLGFFTKNDLSHLYILGYDEITVFFDNDKDLEQIKARVPDCMGYEIIEQTEKKVIIKAVSTALESEFDNILSKVLVMMKEMGSSIYDALKNKEFNRLKQIRELEPMNNRFTSFLLRLLSKKGYKKQNRTLQAYDLIQNLERLADEYKYLCDSFENSKKPIDKPVLDLLKGINDYFDIFYRSYYKFTPERKIALYTDRKALRKNAYLFLNKNKESILTHHLVNILEKIYNSVGSYLALMHD